MNTNILSMRGNDFILDGKPVLLISGAMHYFRIHPELWQDRLLKLKAMGMNIVETYMPWNLHEPKPGQFDFSGFLDIKAYIQLAEKLGLTVIVRPGPYICGEWDMGGLPYWLLREEGMKLRCHNTPFLSAVDRYFKAIFPILGPLQASKGGPIIAMQLENEYGAYGNDKDYLRTLEQMMREHGCEVFVFTTDGAADHFQQGGTLPHLLSTITFGSKVAERMKILRTYQTEGPLMCMEFWDGWFDTWGGRHRTRGPEDVANALDELLAAGDSVNIYMAHGGTNFGFMNGANCHNIYEPTISSYDYDAPIAEDGDLTEKFYAFQRVLSKYTDIPEIAVDNSRKMAYGDVAMHESVHLFDALDSIARPVHSTTTLTMEELDQAYGFVLYETRLNGPLANAPLTIWDVHDRAQIFLDDEFAGIVSRLEGQQTIEISVPPEGATLKILVENMGRVNYGPLMSEPKGITRGVTLFRQLQFHWTMYSLPLDNIEHISFAQGARHIGPAFYRGIFHVADRADTFLRLDGWKKGNAFLNGFNLGRYWEIGPTKTLYIPAPLLKEGGNELVVFELEGCQKLTAKLVDKPDLG